jgi:hypothetical protein
MIPARALTVCVGISAYRPIVLEPGEKPLQYLAASARNLSDLFRAAWPNPRSRHLSAVDSAAARAAVGSIISAESDRYDLFVFYLGGHGRVSGGQFQFLFYGESTTEAVANTDAIDDLVRLCNANQCTSAA